MKDPLCCASTTAAVDPIIPTLIPHVKLVSPTAVPAAKIPYPYLLETWNFSQLPGPCLEPSILLNSNSGGFPESKMVTITP